MAGPSAGGGGATSRVAGPGGVRGDAHGRLAVTLSALDWPSPSNAFLIARQVRARATSAPRCAPRR